VERIIERPMRRRLPDTRHSITHHFNVAGHEGYLTVGMYDDHAPGELFITMSKEGSTIGGLMDSLGTAISVALQYGVPIESLVTKFAHQRFEPMGMSTNRDIPFAKSLVDYIFRWMGMEFIPGYREANAPPRTQAANKLTTEPSATVKEDKTTWLETNAGMDASRMQQPASRLNGSNGDTVRIEEASVRIRPTGDGGAGPNIVTAAAQMIVETHTDRSGTTSRLVAETSGAVLAVNPLDQSNAALMGDAPACDSCGSITVRNGSCYKCMNCGQSAGCS
jgi:ribonucleoside-diphosphate reductase alpha chain